jgi:hypothetical protein
VWCSSSRTSQTVYTVHTDFPDCIHPAYPLDMTARSFCVVWSSTQTLPTLRKVTSAFCLLRLEMFSIHEAKASSRRPHLQAGCLYLLSGNGRFLEVTPFRGISSNNGRARARSGRDTVGPAPSRPIPAVKCGIDPNSTSAKHVRRVSKRAQEGCHSS